MATYVTRKIIEMNTMLESFEAAHPVIAKWWTGNTFEFAVSLRDQVARGKLLSEKQIAAAQRCAANFVAKAEVEASAPEVKNINLIEYAFARARAKKLLAPKMRLLGSDDQVYVISQAQAYGANAGALYVKQGTGEEATYMGKIKDGRFVRVSACSAETEAVILAACDDPEHSSVAYGKRFGICSCCGRVLTNALSIELGIGPICREKFFS